MGKQITNTLLGLFLAFFLVSGAKAQNVSVWDGTAAIWTQGSGTAMDPYLIESAQNLAYIAEMVNAGVTTYSGVWFKLTTDLNMNNISWEPIGHNYCFCGKFDGNNHFINNINIVNNYDNCGLFGKTGDSLLIENLNTQINVTQSNNNIAGGIIGYASGYNAVIRNCRCAGTVNAINYAGGIIGRTNIGSITIQNCNNLSLVSSMTSGGIVGYLSSDGVTTRIVNCINSGNIESRYHVSGGYSSLISINKTRTSGGIIGSIGTSSSQIYLEGCSNNGEVSSFCSCSNIQTNVPELATVKVYSYSGGLVGYAYSRFIINKCFNTGYISGYAYSAPYANYTSGDYKSYSYSGGIVGQCVNESNSAITNCYNMGNITKYSQTSGASSGIFSSSSNGVTINNCYNVGQSGSGIASSSQSTNVYNSYYLITSSNGGAGVSKTESQMKSPSFSIILNIDSIVYIQNINFNQGYPIFNDLTYLKTDTASQISFTKANLNGIYTNVADVIGFQYKETINNSYTTVYVNTGSPAEYLLTDLQSGTNYTYRFFVQKDGNTYYGNEVSFTTLSCDLQASIDQTVTEICDGDSAIFTASCSSAHSNLFTYQWNTSETGNMLQVSDATTHTVTVQDTNGCSATASAAVEVLPLPQGIISGNTSLCAGESTVLTASGSNRYLWNTGANTPIITVNTSGTYTCTFTNSYNCSMSQSVEVNVLESPVISGNLNICEGGSTTLTASGGNAYLWSNGAQTPSITVNNADTYIVTATSGNCSATASVTTSVISLPQVSISGNTVICSGIGTTLTANEGTTYLWSNGASTQSITANNPGTYAVTVSNAAGCSNSASVNVTLMDNVTISGVPYICQGESTTLSVSNEGNYQWNNGANTSFISVSQPGNYSVTVTLPNGCSSSATINVTEASNPTPAISGNTSICEGQSTTLTANGGNSYVWSNASTQNNITVSQSGIYTVTATNAEGCTASTSTTVIVNSLPNVCITGNNSFCQGSSTTLTANGANSYVWNNNSTDASLTVNSAGTYTVTGTDNNGCSNTASKTVSLNPTYTIPLTHSICEGENYNFYGQNLTTAGTYTHTLQTVAGCDSVLSLTLSVKALPTPIITGNTTLCEGETTTLTATGGNSYMWSNGSTNDNISVSQSGIYTVTATNAEGCSATANITVSVNPLPNVSISGNTTICQGSNTTLIANGADSYSWSTGENTASINVSAFGIYTVTGTSAAGCSNTATATVIISQAPVITITGNTELCEGESTTLTANGGSSYLWSNGTTGANLSVNIAGTYQVIGYNDAGCNTMAETTVHVWQPATSEFTITTTENCYEWNGQSYCQSGDYNQTLQTIHGCDSVVTLHLTITVGIDAFDLANVMKLYPNPTKDVVNVQLTINNEQLDGVCIQVFDVYGRLLQVVNMADARGASLKTTQIDLSQYSKGVYFVKAVAEGKIIAVRKVVKK